MEESVKLPTTKKGTAYSYIALTSQDKLVRGTIKATSEAEAGRILSDSGLKLVSLEPLASKLSLEQLFPSFFGIKSKEVLSFSRQLATLLESGIPLLSSLELLHRQVTSRGFKKVLSDMSDDLRSGASLSDALAKHPKVFDDVYCKTVATAEQTGNLHNILRQLSEYQEKFNLARKKVTGALVYPTIVLGLGFIVAAILFTTALPSLIDMFEEMDTELPLPTKILIGFSNFVNGFKLYILVVIASLAALIVWLIKQPRGRLWLDRVILRTPVIGPPLHSSEMARLSRTASVLLNADLPLQEVMELLPQTTGNRAIRQSLVTVNQSLIRGEGIYQPMSRDEIFPPLLLQMVAVGEESNTLPSTLSVSADFYESDADDKIGYLVGFIQPVSTIVIALLVGFLALAVIMPMYSITGAFD